VKSRAFYTVRKLVHVPVEGLIVDFMRHQGEELNRLFQLKMAYIICTILSEGLQFRHNLGCRSSKQHPDGNLVDTAVV